VLSDSNRDWGENTDEAIQRRNILSKVRQHEEIIPLEDGFQYFYPLGRGGLSAVVLRIIADELDRLNAPWKKQIEEDLS
jgi:hypothetical protein